MEKLSNPKETIQVLQKHEFQFKKKFGQNFLIDPHVLDKIVDAAQITKDDFVLEIGPGIGTLTQYLCENARQVLAVEIDDKLIPILKETLQPYDNVEVLHGDILKQDIQQIADTYNDGKPIKVVANLPYYITTPIIMELFESHVPLANVTVMVQKEAAQRLCAAPGTREAGAISYAVAYYAKPKLLFTVQPGSFYPAPKVISAVIQLDVHTTPPVTPPNGDEAGLFRLIRAAFSQRRKTAANAVANGLGISKAKVNAALQAAGLDIRLRPEQLTLEDYCALQAALAAAE